MLECMFYIEIKPTLNILWGLVQWVVRDEIPNQKNNLKMSNVIESLIKEKIN